ncbi:gallinacin-5-like [Haemorhous mexicanus]|uniref:gallinacin-5-like n=1 Tax=Haemorhous mexicanus TaxID=30427 RepID=UPI0028BE60BE|nr:gallinacin-5-like [Haemorhous mexicanus]
MQVLHDLQEGTLLLTSASLLFSPELRLCCGLPGMRILPVLCALLLLMLQGVTGLSPVRASAQDCERRGGFCSHRSCPPGIGRIGLCSEQEFCCRMRWYP